LQKSEFPALGLGAVSGKEHHKIKVDFALDLKRKIIIVVRIFVKGSYLIIAQHKQTLIQKEPD
jgi:hypothetical protein